MLKKILFLISFLSVFISFSQNEKNHVLKKFDKNGMKTSILYQENPLINIQEYNQKTINTYKFLQVYKDLFQNNFEKKYSPLSTLKAKSKQSHFNNVIPLSIIHSNYETIKDEAFKNGSVIKDKEGLLKRTNLNSNIFELHSLTIASPLRIKSKGLKATFILSKENIFNTTNSKITSVKIDFDDTLGFKDIVLDSKIDIQYIDAGTKELLFKITFSDGIVLTCKSALKILYSNKDNKNLFNRASNSFTSSITPNLSTYGEVTSYPGEGEYEIFLSTEANAVLDKPIIIIDGFDPKDSRPIVGYTDSGTGNYVSGIYDLLDFNNNGNSTNLGDLVRAEGLDLVILNFPEYTRSADNSLIDGGADYIERNAMLLVELINILNNHPDKVGNEENVIIGPSMGGLISRYALNYMEKNSLEHNTRLWISFDSPHFGANVPIGFQHQFNFLAYGLDDFLIIGNQNIVELQPIVDGMLKSPAARQMLTDQFEAHLENGSDVDFDSTKNLPQTHPFFNIFFDKLNNLTDSGFPENLRKISIINGSGENNRYQNTSNNNLEAGDQILNTTFNVTTGTDITLSVNFTPPSNSEINISHVYLDFAWYIPAFDVTSDANSKAHPFSNGIDAASGGLFDIGALTADFDSTGTVGNYLNALQTDFFNFIPSVSAMALGFTNNQIDWFHKPTGLVTGMDLNNTTPFDAWYMPINNQPHVTVTQDNFNFAWDEIFPAVLHNEDFDINDSYQLVANPVSETIQIKTNKQDVNNLTVKLYSILGQEVVSKTINYSYNLIEIPVDLNSGVYLLVLDDNETSFKTKVIIK